LCRGDSKQLERGRLHKMEGNFGLDLRHANECVVLVQTVDDGAEAGHVPEVVDGVPGDLFSGDKERDAGRVHGYDLCRDPAGGIIYIHKLAVGIEGIARRHGKAVLQHRRMDLVQRQERSLKPCLHRDHAERFDQPDEVVMPVAD